jgi:hypothetical protein
MRFIKEIENNYCKVGLFAWNNKFIIKCEAGLLEQTYKISELDVSGEEEIIQILNDAFLDKVLKRFQEMQTDLDDIVF